MTVRTTYFTGLSPSSPFEPAADDDVFGVVRRPRDFIDQLVDRNIPAVAPPEPLLEAFKTVEKAAKLNDEPIPAAVAWDNVDYERRYRAHIARAGPAVVVDELRDRARERDIWLVCWEKDPRWCHRRLLAETIVADLEDVELVHHPDPTTIPLEVDDQEDDADATLADFAGDA